jgi:hypothetical protein
MIFAFSLTLPKAHNIEKFIQNNTLKTIKTQEYNNKFHDSVNFSQNSTVAISLQKIATF